MSIPIMYKILPKPIKRSWAEFKCFVNVKTSINSLRRSTGCSSCPFLLLFLSQNGEGGIYTLMVATCK